MATVWLDDGFKNTGPLIDCRDRGLLLGDGVFETLLVRGGAPAFLDAHLERMRRGLAALKIDPPKSLERAGEIFMALAERNALPADAAGRITVTRGAGGRGLKIDATAAATMLVTMSSAPANLERPLFLRLVVRRRFTGSVASSIKATGGYLDNLLAFNEALSAGADECVMLNEHGRVACAAAANIFLIEESGALVTPRVAEGALPGIVRGLIVGGDHGLPVRETEVSVDRLQHTSIFLTSSLRGLAPAVYDDAAAPNAQTHALQCLQSWYQDRLTAEFGRSS